MSTTEQITRLAHIVYNLVDILDEAGVAPESEIGRQAEIRARLAGVKMELVELMHEPALPPGHHRGEC
jgi:hypothetical protein